MILGAVIAGGRSTRFGSDKALAMIGGERLIDRTIAALDPQVDRLVVCGREWPGCLSLADRPQAGLGPLGGLAAALRYARLCGFAKLLSVPVDALAIPHDLVAILAGPGPASSPTSICSGCGRPRCRPCSTRTSAPASARCGRGSAPARPDALPNRVRSATSIDPPIF